MVDRIWISWTEQRRNAGIACGIDARLYTFSYERHRFLRYPLSILKTLSALLREKPKICCAMLPSMFCALFLAVLKGFFAYRLVIDLHTLNVYYLLGEGIKRSLYDRLLAYCLDKADLVVVTNALYAKEMALPEPKTFLLPDRIPEDIEQIGNIQNSRNGNSVLCICSYDPDEAYEQVLSAASRMPDIDFFFSGNFRVLEKLGNRLPSIPNIHFTGFIPAMKYESLLSSVNAVVVTTRLEGCLSCGAYEAFAVGKPLVLSSTQALRSYFGEGPIYTDNHERAIEKAIREALKNQKTHVALMKQRAVELKADWRSRINRLNTLLKEMFV